MLQIKIFFYPNPILNPIYRYIKKLQINCLKNNFHGICYNFCCLVKILSSVQKEFSPIRDNGSQISLDYSGMYFFFKLKFNLKKDKPY